MMLAALLLALAPQDALVIVLDDVGLLDLERGVTPHLAALAAQGIEFTRCYANPTCAPSRMSLMTGHWWTTNTGSACVPADALTPRLAELFPPERLPAHTTALFGKWHLGGNRRGGPWERAPKTQGFDHWLAGSAANLNACGGTSYSSWLRVENDVARLSTAYQPDVVRDALVTNWPLAPSPRLAYVCTALAHSPFHPPPGYSPFLPQSARYDAMLAYLDATVGAMLAAVDLEETLVIVVGDNGTPPQYAPDPNRAKATTFERGVRVPLLVAGGPVRAPGRTSDQLVHIVDLYQTVLDWGGARPVRTPYPVAGRSLLPILLGHDAPLHSWVICGDLWKIPGVEGDRCIVSADGFKLRQLDHDGDGTPDSEELYDLVADPDETRNLLAALPAQAQTLRVKLAAESLP
jgi:arylsulfatase A-like enzyme